MLSDNQEENLYTIVSNLLQDVDTLLRKQIQIAGNIHYFFRQHEDAFNDVEKKEVEANLDIVQNQFQVVRDDITTANKCLRLLGLPELDLNGVVELDETHDKTKV